MSTQRTIDVQGFINAHRLSAMQVLTLLLCFFIVAVDGFDTAAIGFIAPAIRAEWGLTAAHLAPVFGAGLAGLMAGAFLFGPLADRFGRKTILMACVGFFGLACLASAYSTSLGMLVVLRFLTGLGLGGAMPNSVTLSSEYAPEKHRSVLVTTMFCGFTLGSALGGVVAAHIVASFGWRAVLVIGGVLPLVLLPVLAMTLPESVRYLVMKGRKPEQVRRTLQRIAPSEDLSASVFAIPEKALRGFPVKHLFDRNLRRGTLFTLARVFHESARDLPAVELAADADQQHRHDAEKGVARHRDVAGGRHGRCDCARAIDGPLQSTTRVGRNLRVGGGTHPR